MCCECICCNIMVMVPHLHRALLTSQEAPEDSPSLGAQVLEEERLKEGVGRGREVGEREREKKQRDQGGRGGKGRESWKRIDLGKRERRRGERRRRREEEEE